MKEEVVRFDVPVGVSTLMHSLQYRSDFQHCLHNHFKGRAFTQLLLERGGQRHYQPRFLRTHWVCFGIENRDNALNVSAIAKP
ncbi:hypothetical protein D3C77_526260 [compost metagenome]